MSPATETPIKEKHEVAAPRAATTAPPADHQLVTVIERRPGWRIVDLSELWRFRELLFFFIWRDVKVRYKQTVLGASWSVLQPLATVVVFSLFLGKAGGLSEHIPNYPLFVLAGVLPWTFFGNALGAAASSVVGNQHLVTKIYFPRLLLPLSTVGANLVDFVIAFGMLVVAMLWYGASPGWTVLALPLIVLLLMAATTGVGTLLSALLVEYRDFKFILTFLVQLWMFATPTIYLDSATLGSRSQTWLPLNPAYGLIDNFRRSVLGQPLDLYSLGVSAAVSVGILLVGCLYFRQVERNFADVI
jgi:lipopolysaccharide transport system permease protein